MNSEKPIWLTKEWLGSIGPNHTHIKTRGTKLVFIGKKGRMLRCRLGYLARREKISFRQFIIKAILRGMLSRN